MEAGRADLDIFFDDLQEMDPIISYKQTKDGWRGITIEGEIYDVKGGAAPPEKVIVARGGRPIGRRAIRHDVDVDIDNYLRHYNRAIGYYKAGMLDEALQESELSLMELPSLRAKFNHSMILLASGKWRQGFQEYWQCEQQKPFMRPATKKALDAGLKPWMGEPLTGKRLLLLHAHGFGDTIQMLRYVPRLKKAVMVVPVALHELALQCGEVVDDLVDCDFFCPILHLLHILNVTPQQVARESYIGYLDASSFCNWWARKLGSSHKRRIGLAWSVGQPSDSDYPREIDLAMLADHFGNDVELHSVQLQDTAKAKDCGVITHEFEDFADCAGLMINMDEIVSVDTAALHLAGAIGHPKVTGLLSFWSSWRWKAQWYTNVRLLRQTSLEDWGSALAQL